MSTPALPSDAPRPPLMRSVRLMVLGCVAVVGSLVPPSGAHAVDAAALCQKQKARFAGQYAACMHDARGRLATEEGSCSTSAVRTGYGYDLTIDELLTGAGYSPGQMLAVAAHADAAFEGTLALTAYASSFTRVAVWINGHKQGEVELEALSGPRELYASTSVAVDVSEGLVVVRLEILEGNPVFYSVDL